MGKNSIPIFIVLIFISQSLLAQDTNRYVVFFKDKNGTPYSVSNPDAFLSLKSIQRRENQQIAISNQDLPVNPTYKQQVAGVVLKVLYSTKWMNAVVVEARTDQLTDIQALSFVSGLELAARGKNGFTGSRMRASNKFFANEAALPSDNQNKMLALDLMHEDGYKGEGVTIAVLDTGFPGVTTNPAFNDIISEGRILDSYNFSNVNGNAFVGNQHGAQVFSEIAAKSSGFVGGAYEASFLLYATEFVQTEYRIEEYNWLAAAERADSAGADIITSSLGYVDFDDPSMDYTYEDLDGSTALITRAANIAFEKGIIVVISAGNYGNTLWQKIGTPADGENVIAVGSVNSDYNHSSFSSFGPTVDGRIKPDVMAMGGAAATVLPNGQIGYNNGTSLSAPLIASLIAGIKQKAPNKTATEITSLIRTVSSNTFSPDTVYGYGIPTYTSFKNALDVFQIATQPCNLYPNPADDHINIAFGSVDGTDVRVRISSLLGKAIYETVYSSVWELNPIQIDLSTVAPGIYLVIVENKLSTYTLRLIKR